MKSNPAIIHLLQNFNEKLMQKSDSNETIKTINTDAQFLILHKDLENFRWI